MLEEEMSKKKALVSFIMPVYNSSEYIHVSLLSILTQKKHNLELEIMIIDDGSTDNSLEVAEKIINNYKSNLNNKIQYQIIKIPENRGPAFARNLGIQKSSGDYLIFIDSDDYFSNDLMCSLEPIIMYHNPDFIIWRSISVRKNKERSDNHPIFRGKKLKMKAMSGLEALNELLVNKKAEITMGTYAIKKEVISTNNLLFSEDLRNYEDVEFSIKALCLSKKVIFITKSLFFRTIRECSLSKNFSFESLVNIYKSQYRTKQFLKLIKEHLYNNPDKSRILNMVLETIEIKALSSSLYIIGELGRLKTNVIKTLKKEYPEVWDFLITNSNKYAWSKLKLTIKERVAFQIFRLSPQLFLRLYKLNIKK